MRFDELYPEIGRPPAPSEGAPLSVDGPLDAPTRGRKNTAAYNAHSYPTKVPPEAIEPFIEHHTRPGDVVLDAFCGLGMTGLAARRARARARGGGRVVAGPAMRRGDQQARRTPAGLATRAGRGRRRVTPHRARANPGRPRPHRGDRRRAAPRLVPERASRSRARD